MDSIPNKYMKKKENAFVGKGPSNRHLRQLENYENSLVHSNENANYITMSLYEKR